MAKWVGWHTLPALFLIFGVSYETRLPVLAIGFGHAVVPECCGPCAAAVATVPAGPDLFVHHAIQPQQADGLVSAAP